MFVTLNNIVVPLDIGEYSSARLRLATKLSERFDARLIGVAAREASRPRGHGKGGIITSKMIDSERRHALYELSLVEAAFRKETKNVKRADFFSSILEPSELLIDRARTADLVLSNRPYNGDLDEWFADLSPTTLLMRLGCPLLVVPLGFDGPVGQRIVIAWKDTREARRVVREAWPFLEKSESVSILTVGSQNEAIGASELADTLRRAGIICRNVLIDKKLPRVSSSILKFAEEEKADLLISGAQGHARVQDFIFGSVTRDLLDGSSISCFLSR